MVQDCMTKPCNYLRNTVKGPLPTGDLVVGKLSQYFKLFCEAVK